MAKRTAKRKAALPTVNDNKATMVVTLYDGTRQQIQGKKFLIRILDGFQNMLFDDYKTAPTTVFRLPVLPARDFYIGLHRLPSPSSHHRARELVRLTAGLEAGPIRQFSRQPCF
jgi:hypothetical protein